MICAIGFKDWVELRSYKNLPKAEEDTIIKTVKQHRIEFGDPDGWNRKIIEEEVPHKICTVYYPGGKVLYTLKTARLKYLGVYVADGKCVRLSNMQLKAMVGHGGFDKLKRFIKSGE